VKTLVRLIAATLIVVVVGCSAARPLHRSEASIQASLLKRTPLGTSRTDVQKFITRQGWELQRDSFVPSGAPSPRDTVCFGGYAIFIGTSYVYGEWTFDAGEKLIKFRVYKSRDVL
jgi:hypothetical protein